METLKNENQTIEKKMDHKLRDPKRPTGAFIGASWTALIVGMVSYCVGLYNAETFPLYQKGFYITILLYGLFASVSVQKSVRDRLEGIPVTDIYYGLSWFSIISAILLLVIGLWNNDLSLSEKGFFGIAYLMSIFSSIAVQKNTRDIALLDKE